MSSNYSPRADLTATQRGARHCDPITSHLADRASARLKADHHRIILEVLRTRGAAGKDQIAAWCHLLGHQVGKRMSELEREGQARVVPGRYTRSASGRLERVWEVVT